MLQYQPLPLDPADATAQLADMLAGLGGTPPRDQALGAFRRQLARIQQGVQEQFEAVVGGVDHGPGDTGLLRDCLDRHVLVAVADQDVQRCVEQLLPALVDGHPCGVLAARCL